MVKLLSESIKNQIDVITYTSERLLGIVRKRELQWFGHLVRENKQLCQNEHGRDGRRKKKRQTRETVDR